MATAQNEIITRQAGDWINGKVAASTQLFQGTLGYYNATGFLDDDTASGLNKFAGVVREEQDNSSGSAGDLDGVGHSGHEDRSPGPHDQGNRVRQRLRESLRPLGHVVDRRGQYRRGLLWW